MEDFLAFIFVVLMFVGLFVGIPYSVAKYSEYNCYKNAEMYQVEAKYNWSTGCFLKYEGEYIPKKEYERLLYWDRRFKD